MDARACARLGENVSNVRVHATTRCSAYSVNRLFETAAGDLADSVRGGESQVSGAEKGDHEVLRKHLCRLLGSDGKGLPSPFEPLSTKVYGQILKCPVSA